jgi:hypothetical protein
MTLSDLANIGSLINGVAVLVSLIYLSLQIRQAAKNQQSSVHHGRAQQATEYIRYITQADIYETVMRGSTGDVSLDMMQANRFVISQQCAFLILEDLLLQYREHMLDEAQYRAVMEQLRYQCSLSGFRGAWMLSRGNFGKDFAKVMDDMIAKTPVATWTAADRAAAWKAYTTAELAKGQKAP